MDYLKVLGHDGLVRDSSSGAIVNTNRAEYEQYMETKRRLDERENKISQHSNEINNIKTELQEIKGLLLQLINKG
jgi:predicted transcriptional regulator